MSGGVFFYPNGTSFGANVTANVTIDAGTATDAVALPTGNTNQRPATSAPGQIRFNTDSNNFEGYKNSWVPLGGGSTSGNVQANSGSFVNAVSNINFVNTTTTNVAVTSNFGGTTANVAISANTTAIVGPYAGIVNAALNAMNANVANVTSISNAAVYEAGTLVLGVANINFNNTATVNTSAVANGSTQVNVSSAVNMAANYTWSGTIQFIGPYVSTALVNNSQSGTQTGTGGGATLFGWTNFGAAANNRVWESYGFTDGTWHLRAVEDDNNNSHDALALFRSGITITQITIGNATDQPAIIANGQLVVYDSARQYPLVVWSTQNTGGIQVSGVVNTSAGMAAANSNGIRWFIGKDQSPETGANVGSNFGIWAYGDNGGFINEWLTINRITGNTNVFSNLNVTNNVLATGLNATVLNVTSAAVTSLSVGTENVSILNVSAGGSITDNGYLQVKGGLPGVATINSGGVTIGSQVFGNIYSQMFFCQNAAVDYGWWEIVAQNTGVLQFRTANDTYSNNESFFTIHRANANISSITLGDLLSAPTTTVQGNLTVQRLSGNRSLPELIASDGTQAIYFNSNSAAGAFSPLANVSDSTVFGKGSAINTAVLTLMTWASDTTGIRMTNNTLLIVASQSVNIGGAANIQGLVSQNTMTFANGGSQVQSANQNFNNTATVNVAVAANGSQANLSFTANISAIAAAMNNQIVMSEQFTATVNQTTFLLNNQPIVAGPQYLWVQRNGLTVEPTTHYVLNPNNSITFSSNCSVGDAIEVRELIAANMGTPATIFNSEQFTCTANQTVFNLNNNIAGAQYLFVSLNGLTLAPVTDYSISGGLIGGTGNVVTLSSNTSNGDFIEFLEILSVNTAVTLTNLTVQQNTTLNGAVFMNNSTGVLTVQMGTVTSQGSRIVLESNTGSGNDAYIEFVLGAAVRGYIGVEGALGDLVQGPQVGDIVLSTLDTGTNNVYVKSANNIIMNAVGHVIANGVSFDPVWTAPTLNASMVFASGAPDSIPAYWKDPFGIVHLRGLLQFSTGAGTANGNVSNMLVAQLNIANGLPTDGTTHYFMPTIATTSGSVAAYVGVPVMLVLRPTGALQFETAGTPNGTVANLVLMALDGLSYYTR